MPNCLIGLGSNQGDRQAALDEAVARLKAESAGAIVARSQWRETSPVGGPAEQNDFLNGALLLETALGPHELLACLQRIEDQLGRRRKERWGPRTIDLDLLLYDDLVLNSPSLVLPHPRLAYRRFVLEPAAVVAGSMLHPTIGWTIAQLLAHLNASPQYVAVTGPIAAGKTRLAKRLAAALSGRLVVERPDWPRLAAFYAEPAGHGIETELEFLNHRASLLREGEAPAEPIDYQKTNATRLAAAGTAACGITRPTYRRPLNGETRWTISDFWFDQSAAFARVWLSAENLPRFLEEYDRLRPRVVQPRMIVLLDSPREELLKRVRRRGRRCESRLTADQLERIRRAVADQASRPDLGPVLRIGDVGPKTVFAEVLAAVRGME